MGRLIVSTSDNKDDSKCNEATFHEDETKPSQETDYATDNQDKEKSNHKGTSSSQKECRPRAANVIGREIHVVQVTSYEED